MAKITESQLRSIIKQELRGLLEEKTGLGILLGDYNCDELSALITKVQKEKDYPGEVDGFSKEEVIAGIKQKMNSPKCKGK